MSFTGAERPHSWVTLGGTADYGGGGGPPPRSRSLIPDHQSTVTSRDNGARTPAAAVASQLHQLFYFLSFALGFLLFGLFLRSGDINFILVIIEFIPLVPLSQILHASALIS